MTPQPFATQFKASSATNTGTPSSFSNKWSNPVNKAPPPVKKIPRDIISAANSGGVCSKTCLVSLTIVWQVSRNANSVSSAVRVIVWGNPVTKSRPLTSNVSSLIPLIAIPISIYL